MSLSKKKPPEEKSEPVIKTEYIFINKSQLNGFNSYSIKIGLKTISFSLQSAVSGCGLGIFGNWTQWVSPSQPTMHDPTLRIICDLLRDQAMAYGYYCLIATLGDTYTKLVKNDCYEKILADMGFKEIHSYNNKNHGSGYMQNIYACDLNNLK